MCQELIALSLVPNASHLKVILVTVCTVVPVFCYQQQFLKQNHLSGISSSTYTEGVLKN